MNIDGQSTSGGHSREYRKNRVIFTSAHWGSSGAAGLKQQRSWHTRALIGDDGNTCQQQKSGKSMLGFSLHFNSRGNYTSEDNKLPTPLQLQAFPLPLWQVWIPHQMDHRLHRGSISELEFSLILIQTGVARRTGAEGAPFSAPAPLLERLINSEQWAIKALIMWPILISSAACFHNSLSLKVGTGRRHTGDQRGNRPDDRRFDQPGNQPGMLCVETRLITMLYSAVIWRLVPRSRGSEPPTFIYHLMFHLQLIYNFTSCRGFITFHLRHPAQVH